METISICLSEVGRSVSVWKEFNAPLWTDEKSKTIYHSTLNNLIKVRSDERREFEIIQINLFTNIVNRGEESQTAIINCRFRFQQADEKFVDDVLESDDKWFREEPLSLSVSLRTPIEWTFKAYKAKQTSTTSFIAGLIALKPVQKATFANPNPIIHNRNTSLRALT